jgi:hypothetical protein
MTLFRQASISLAKTGAMPPDRGQMASGEGDPPPVTIGMVLPLLWSGRHEMRRPPSTIARYREALNWVIRDIGDLPVARLNVGHILGLRRRMDQRGCARPGSPRSSMRCGPSQVLPS